MNPAALVLPTFLYARDPLSLALTTILYSPLYRLIFYFPGISKGFVLPDNLYQTDKISGRFVGGLIAHGPAITTDGEFLPSPFLSGSLKAG